MMWVNYKKLDPAAKIFVYQTAGAVAADIHALEDCTVVPGRTTLVRTGIAIQIPDGYVGQVCPRSGLSLKHGITVVNAPGLIDSDYRGEVCVILSTNSNKIFDIKAGDRIGQLMFTQAIRAIFKEVDNLTETDRGEGGFGSTGTESK